MELVESNPNITSDPTYSAIFDICLVFNFIIFSYKILKILAAFIEPPPKPDFCGIFLVTFIKYFDELIFLSKSFNNFEIVLDEADILGKFSIEYNTVIF